MNLRPGVSYFCKLGSILLVGGVLLLAGCGTKGGEASSGGGGRTCSTLTGTAWTPNVTGVSTSNRDGTVSVTKTTSTATNQPVIGLEQAAPGSKEVSVTIDMSTDLGTYGSLTLVAEVKNKPSALSGGIYPVLVSLSDGTNDLVNIARTGAGGDCAQSGYYVCTSGSCSANSACKPSSPSAYLNRTHWIQHQVHSFDYTSVNGFPNCNWAGGTFSTGGTPDVTLNPGCAFNSGASPFFVSGKLRSGVNYTAKYVLLAEYEDLSSYDYRADLQVTAIKKSDASAGGAIDLNVILVGNNNVSASRTAKGKQNLDALFKGVVDIYGANGITFGAINAIEWDCANGGDTYVNVNSDDLDLMFAASRSLISSSNDPRTLNVYIVSTIPYSSNSSVTLLGIAGAIRGSPLNGTALSGAVFASFNQIDTFNPSCNGTGTCAVTSQEADFRDMSSTIAHEMGHYLGLNHPSESGGTAHDPVIDTPRCTYKAGGSSIGITSCRNTLETSTYDTDGVYSDSGSGGQKCSQVCSGYNGSTTFCATKKECQFNHVMWWTSKNYEEGTTDGDGNIFSTYSTRVMDHNPLLQ